MRLTASYGYGDEIGVAVFSSDGIHAVVDGLFPTSPSYLWTLRSGELATSELGLAGNWLYRLSPDGKHLAVVGWDDVVHLVDLEHKSVLWALDNGSDYSRVDFSPGCKVPRSDKPLRIHQSVQRKHGCRKVIRFGVPGGWPVVMFSADGDELFFAQNKTAALWDATAPTQLQMVPTNLDLANALALRTMEQPWR